MAAPKFTVGSTGYVVSGEGLDTKVESHVITAIITTETYSKTTYKYKTSLGLTTDDTTQLLTKEELRDYLTSVITHYNDLITAYDS